MVRRIIFDIHPEMKEKKLREKMKRQRERENVLSFFANRIRACILLLQTAGAAGLVSQSGVEVCHTRLLNRLNCSRSSYNAFLFQYVVSLWVLSTSLSVYLHASLYLSLS